ncbi:MAG: MFS transporter [Hyphomicrobiales bacterium]|nr:MFS transporter [Hyphomicrobiales bacterium]
MSELMPLHFDRRMSAFYAALFLGIGVYQPFFPLWLQARELDPWQISVILAVPMSIRVFFAPVSGALSDRSANRRPAIIAYTALTAVFFFLLGFTTDFLWIFVTISAAALFWTSIMPLTEALALQGVRRFGADYGRLRLWGSISFIAANFIAGAVLDVLPRDIVHALILAAMILTVIAACRLPLLPVPAEPPLPDASVRPSRVVNAGVFAVLAAAGLVQSSHALIYGFGSLHWQAMGLSGTTIGLLWALGVVAEISFFAVSRHVLVRLSPLALIGIGAGAAILRWCALGLDPPLTGLVVLQFLHGLTFGATHLGTIHFIGRTVPDHRTGAVQGLFFTISGVCMGGSMLASGVLYRNFEGSAFPAMAVLGVAALVLLGIGRGKIYPQSAAGGG